MATKNLPLYGDTQGTIVADDAAATPNTIPMRDSAGNTKHAQCQATELKSTGTLVIATKATQTTTVTLDATATFWPFDATGGALAPALPPAGTVTGRVYAVQKVDSSGNAVTVAANGTEKIGPTL